MIISIKGLFLLLLMYWSYVLLKDPIPWIFLDGVNLMFHEAGHVIFMPFGRFMNVLGGTLLQCLIPFALSLYFLVTKQFYACAFAIFWLGNNFINVSVYARDAQIRVLPLLGGDSSGHDWFWLLSTTGLLEKSDFVASIIWSLGAVSLFASISFYLYLIMLEIFEGKEFVT